MILNNLAWALILVWGLNSTISAQESEPTNRHIFAALGAPAERKVDVAWNRFNDSHGLYNTLKRIHEAYPELTRLYSIGKSYEGRELYCLEITNFHLGNPEHKAGMYIDGNIHGNEVQAGEVVAYTGWYLCETYGKVELVTRLLDRHVFYLIPTINPDGRDHWFHTPNTPHSSRSGKVPFDNDGDGSVDEDGYDDLNGDGAITQMRIRNANGRWKPDPDHPDYLMIRVDLDERGEYDLLGWEGLDNDGDGQINEDEPGGYDGNRDWAFDWQPRYVQRGAQDFPFSLPETRAVAQFVITHPNIAAAQSYHNFGGMILRSPGREGGEMQEADETVMQYIAQKGEQMLPFYRAMVTWRDLYTVWGGEKDWFYGARGVMTFTNELWTVNNMFRNTQAGRAQQADFIQYLLHDQGVVPWKEYDHPTYGKIEIGGTSKEIMRVPPSFLLEEECHRNMCFTLYHADRMPVLTFGEIQTERLRNRLSRIWVEVKNDGMIPTRIAQDMKHHITTRDIVRLSGKGIQVLSSGVVKDPYFKTVESVKTKPERVPIETIPGLSSVRVQFIVEGKGQASIEVQSVKGGRIQKDVDVP